MLRLTAVLQRPGSELGTSAPGTMHAHASSRALHTRSVVAKAASRVVTREDWKGQCRDAVHGSTATSSAILGCTAQNNPSVDWCPAGRDETTLLPFIHLHEHYGSVSTRSHIAHPPWPMLCPSCPRLDCFPSKHLLLFPQLLLQLACSSRGRCAAEDSLSRHEGAADTLWGACTGCL
jgi:hypothetical protein